MLENAKLSNFHFGGAFIGATDQRENTRQNRTRSNSKRLGRNNRAIPKKARAGRAPDVNVVVPQTNTRSCPRSEGRRASGEKADVLQIVQATCSNPSRWRASNPQRACSIPYRGVLQIW